MNGQVKIEKITDTSLLGCNITKICQAIRPTLNTDFSWIFAANPNNISAVRLTNPLYAREEILRLLSRPKRVAGVKSIVPPSLKPVPSQQQPTVKASVPIAGASLEQVVDEQVTRQRKEKRKSHSSSTDEESKRGEKHMRKSSPICDVLEDASWLSSNQTPPNEAFMVFGLPQDMAMLEGRAN